MMGVVGVPRGSRKSELTAQSVTRNTFSSPPSCYLSLLRAMTDNSTSSVTLFYWVLNVFQSASSVDIAKDATVDHLRKAVLKENSMELVNIGAHMLKVWKVCRLSKAWRFLLFIA